MKPLLFIIIIISSHSIKSFSQNNVPKDWKDCVNEKYGYKFKYPPSWQITGNNIETTDKNGNISTNSIILADSLLQISLLVQYQFGLKSNEHYKYNYSQYQTKKGSFTNEAKIIKIAGISAIQGQTTYNTDGRGNTINPPINVVILNFLDKSQKNAFELQFKLQSHEPELHLENLRILLSTFEFIK